MNNFRYRLAKAKDVEHLVSLINSAYRSHVGASWTSEQGIVAGDRINSQQLLLQLEEKNFYLWLAEVLEDTHSILVACVGLTFQQDVVEIGTFCVHSQWQNQGIGKQILQYAESKALEISPTIHHYEMWVLDKRIELIQFYERCGYVKTTCLETYPIHANVGQPLIELHLQHMIKPVMKEI